MTRERGRSRRRYGGREGPRERCIREISYEREEWGGAPNLISLEKRNHLLAMGGNISVLRRNVTEALQDWRGMLGWES